MWQKWKQWNEFDMSISVEFKNVSFRYTGIEGSDQMVLNDISFTLDRPQCTAIIGHSGSGKTTLIQHFTGLLKPSKGNILVDGKDIWSSRYKFSELRKRIGIVFQFPETQLFEETVEKDIAFGPKNLGFRGEDLTRRVHNAMQAVDLQPQKFCHRSPFKISEGEKRRAAIAGVLAMEPEMIVFDEPTAGLDPRGVRKIQKIVRKLLQAEKSVVLVTHNIDFMVEICDRALVLINGAIAYDGDVKELFRRHADIVQKAGLEMPSLTGAIKTFEKILPPDLLQVFTLEELTTRLNALKKESIGS